MIFLNIVVLVLEIMYYSIFMYYAKGEGKFWRYLLLFSLITGIMLLVNTSTIYSYLIFVILSVYGLKYLVKAKTSLYDMLIIIIMIFLGIAIQYPFYLIGLKLGIRYEITFIYEPIKILVILLSRNFIKRQYNKLKIKWNNNNFYIRYIFTCLMYLYVIITIVFIILY